MSDQTIGYRTISVSPLTERIGAVVEGVDARQPLDDDQQAELRDAIARHCVLFLRDQELTARQQLQFASYFGEVNRSDFAPADATGDDACIEFLEDTPERPPAADVWHTDRSFWPTPPDYAVLNCLAAPAVGGDTLWLNLCSVYEALSAPLQAFVDHLRIDVRPSQARVAQVDATHQRVEYSATSDRPGTIHPLVRVHPVTGRRALYLCGLSMYGIEGMYPNESEALFALLRQGLHDPGVQCRWHWRPYDLVIWDECCTNHRALSDHHPRYRHMRRCTTGASVPVGPT